MEVQLDGPNLIQRKALPAQSLPLLEQAVELLHEGNQAFRILFTAGGFGKNSPILLCFHGFPPRNVWHYQ